MSYLILWMTGYVEIVSFLWVNLVYCCFLAPILSWGLVHMYNFCNFMVYSWIDDFLFEAYFCNFMFQIQDMKTLYIDLLLFVSST
ncbi:hypothetical protein RIF29_19755 [Crotalaria pallida]|uniref:Uncharacterized protein n=1 Tax=Crotalaria pallida TaxID=3830 RepID=A0AAN9F317_CROPI